MRWEVRGADASTGEDRLLVMEGLSPEEVEAKARYAGMLVSSIMKVPAAPVVSYAMPQQQKAATPSDVVPPPFQANLKPAYSDILSGARALLILGGILI